MTIVLAGGTSRRFGTNKLDQRLGEQTLLTQALRGLPSGTEIILVGPGLAERPELRAVREDPVGGGPAAGLVTGLRAALATPFAYALVLPGDAPLGGHAASELLAVLRSAPGAIAVMAVDASGREQPLQLALRPAAARALVEAAGASAGNGASARRLVHTLTPPPLRHRLSDAAVFDIDTQAQLAAWLLRDSAAVDHILTAVRRVAPTPRPVVVAIDGPSAAGKSTLAAALALRTEAVVVAGDDFYAGGLTESSLAGLADRTDADLAGTLFDWRRLREEALEPLRQGRAAHYRPYDWSVADGRPHRPRRLEPQPLVVLEGVYAARPELADLVDLTVYVDTDPVRRQARYDDRGDDPRWRRHWERAERSYFSEVRPVTGFDLVVDLGSADPSVS